MNKIPMYVIKDSQNRGKTYMFQNEEDGTQKEAKCVLESPAKTMIDILNQGGSRYYIVIE